MNDSGRRHAHAFIAAVLACLLVHSPLWAQSSGEAVLGQPYGVGRISLPLPSAGTGGEFDVQSVRIVEANERILYPAVDAGRFGEVVAEVLGNGTAPRPDRIDVSFLFTGNEPLELTVLSPQVQQLTIVPRAPRRTREFDRALNRWWKDYSAVARRQAADGDYPPIVETYLTSMLSGRLGLRPPLLTRMQDSEPSELENLLGLLLGVEDLRFAIMRETMQGGGGLGETASLPLPDEVQWQAPRLPAELPDVGIETIAMHVPVECFYIRFGTFENYLWFDRLKDDYGGNLDQMVTLRGHDSGLDEKVQQQLALKKSALAEIVGPQIISDVALIGRDLYLSEGPAIGMLFEARNSPLLQANLEGDRADALARWMDRGATMQTVSVAGHEVSYLSTPDNRLRSFYAIDGDYHLVTTSRAIVEQFYAAGAGTDVLGSAEEFLHARWRMPLDRDDTVFAYFSTRFLRSLLSPQYQVELRRRLQSVTDMELVELAQLAAVGEGQPADSIGELIAGGFLPPSFGQRGSRDVPLSVQHGFVDPRRGARGFFTPIPDVAFESITPSEATLYRRAAQFLQSNWQRMDPLMAGIKRYALPEERMERVVIDANISPLAEEKYGWILSMVGPPTDVAIQSDPSDVLTVQMSLKGGMLWPGIPAHQVFLGVQDLEPSITPVPDGFLRVLHLLQTTPGYLGAWPQLGLLDLFPFLTPQPDVFGFSPLPLGLWRWQGDGFSVLSYHRDVLAEAANFLQPVPTENPAQIQIRVRDLAHSRLAGWLSYLNYSRSAQVSRGNVQLLNALSQQLRVSPSEALDIAGHLLGTQLICTLGGEYQFVANGGGAPRWGSTAWTGDGMPPDGYEAPLLEWFRGATAHLTRQPDGLFLHAEVDMLRKPRDPAVQLPSFDLFGGSKEDQPGDPAAK